MAVGNPQVARKTPHKRKAPSAGGRNALGAHTRQGKAYARSDRFPLTQREGTAAASQPAGIGIDGGGDVDLANHRSASVTQTPHSPQLKVPMSGRPSVPSVMRLRCIDLPQFGQAGRTVTWWPTGRIHSCVANIVHLFHRFSNNRLKFKRLFETSVGRKQGISVISQARLKAGLFIHRRPSMWASNLRKRLTCL